MCARLCLSVSGVSGRGTAANFSMHILYRCSVLLQGAEVERWCLKVCRRCGCTLSVSVRWRSKSTVLDKDMGSKDEPMGEVRVLVSAMDGRARSYKLKPMKGCDGLCASVASAAAGKMQFDGIESLIQ